MNKKGFVMIETIIVMSVLAIGLIALYSSYNIILSKASATNYYDEPEDIYKTYMINEFLKNYSITSDVSNSNSFYVEIDLDTCKLKSYKYVSSLSSVKEEDITYCNQLKIYDVKKIYYFNKFQNINDNSLVLLDGYAINYLRIIKKQGFNTGIVGEYKLDNGRTSLAYISDIGFLE